MPSEMPRAVQSVNEMAGEQKPNLWPSLEAPMHIVKHEQETSTFQHDFADIHHASRNQGADNNTATLQTQDSAPGRIGIPRPPSQQSSATMLRPPTSVNEAAKATIQSHEGLRMEGSMKQAGKIVHQFRSYQETAGGAKKAPRQPRAGSQVRRSGDYVPVRHNRTSMMRQNKHVKESLVQRCNSCLFSSAEAPGSQERSCPSGHSSTDGTRKNVQAKTALQRETSIDWHKGRSAR